MIEMAPISWYEKLEHRTPLQPCTSITHVDVDTLDHYPLDMYVHMFSVLFECVSWSLLVDFPPVVTSEYITTTVDNTPNDTLGFDHVSKGLHNMWLGLRKQVLSTCKFQSFKFINSFL